jgi:hypothetical protein
MVVLAWSMGYRVEWDRRDPLVEERHRHLDRILLGVKIDFNEVSLPISVG